MVILTYFCYTKTKCRFFQPLVLPYSFVKMFKTCYMLFFVGVGRLFFVLSSFMLFSFASGNQFCWVFLSGEECFMLGIFA